MIIIFKCLGCILIECGMIYIKVIRIVDKNKERD